MKISELGEFGLIDILDEIVASEEKSGEAWDNLIIGIGDDAAAWSSRAAAWRSSSGVELATIDAMVQDVHFKLGMTSWEELGWKSLAINLSDIAAMGGSPRYALVSLGLPGETDVRDIIFLYQGMLELARQYEVAVIGGNISGSPLVTINIAVYGNARRPEELLARSGARPGDKIAVTGYLGAAAAGLEMLTGGLSFDTQTTVALRKSFLQPVPRVKEGLVLVESGVRAGIDISDGFVSDLGHICKASGLGARVRNDLLPVAPVVKTHFSDRARELALSGGEDYELLFTAPMPVMEVVKSAIGCPVTIVGEMVLDQSAGVILLDENGNIYSPPKAGWDHFPGE
jgi:thiamine-monophosphate kinase